MQNILPEILQLNIPFIFLLIISAISAYLSYYIYRQTNPQSSVLLKYGLGIFRMLLLILLIFLFFNPKIFYQFVKKNPVTIALFIDNSSSMGLVNDTENRPDSLSHVINSLQSVLDAKDVRSERFTFNNAIQQLDADSALKYQGLTDFNALIRYISSSQTDQAIVISDGVRTEGPYPSSATNIPIYSIGLGKIKAEPDIFIQDVAHNPVIYQGSEQEISVKIANTNVRDTNIRVLLFAGKDLISTQQLLLEQENSEQQVQFKYALNKTGLNKLRVQLQADIKDANADNNSFNFTQEVVKNKLRVGIFAAYPDYEHKFLKYVLKQLPEIEVYSYINIRNKMTSDFNTDSLDLLIFSGFPGRNTSAEQINSLRNTLRQSGQNLVVMLTGNTDIQKLAVFESSLPLSEFALKSVPLNGVASFVSSRKLHPVLQVFENEQLNSSFWNSIPPLDVEYTLDSFKKNAESLLQINDMGRNEAVLVLAEDNRNKAVLLNGTGFWRWHFFMQNQNDLLPGYTNFIKNIIRWTADKRKFKPVILETNKNTVNPGHEIILEVSLYNASNEKIKNGQVTLNAAREGQSFTVDMLKDSSGTFQGRYTPSAEGTFVFSATGFLENKQFGQDTKNVEVIPYDREFIRTLQDTLFLQKLAEQSGGAYFNSGDVQKIAEYLDLEPGTNRISNEVDLRYQSWLLFLIIGLASAEWIIRKKNNLV